MSKVQSSVDAETVDEIIFINKNYNRKGRATNPSLVQAEDFNMIEAVNHMSENNSENLHAFLAKAEAIEIKSEVLSI